MMEDLRKKEKVPVYTGNIPNYNFYNKLKLIGKITLVLVAVVLLLIYPFEIGSAIGYWIHSFIEGLTFRF